MKKAFALGLSAFPLLVAACGSKTPSSSGPTSTTVSGTIGGTPVSTAETLGIYGTDVQTGRPVAGFWITNSTGWCPLLQAGAVAPPSTTVLWAQVYNNASTSPLSLGTYQLGGPSADGSYDGVSEFIESDAQCKETASQGFTGSITFDALSATSVAGTFDLTTTAGDHLTGAFDGPVCIFDAMKLGTTGTCTPQDGGP